MKTKTALTLACIFVGSLIITALLPASAGIFKNLAAAPAVGALAGALFLLFRDWTAHQRALSIAEIGSSVSIGAMSHMANVAFDKHVLFCEEYATEMFETLNTLFIHGPDQRAIDHYRNFAGIRRKWAVWLTTDVETNLDKFESAIWTIGNNERLIREYPTLENRQQLIEEMMMAFVEVIGEREWHGKPVNQDIAIKTIMARLRDVLGISELTSSRATLIRRATDNLKDRE
jgi:hypothetical protein